MKRSTKPWFKSYFSDSAVQSLSLCSLAAQGLWAQMYVIFHRDPIGVLAVGPRTLTKDDLFSQSGLSSKDFPMVSLQGSTSKGNVKVGPRTTRELFDSLFDELLEAELFEVNASGVIYAQWLIKREETRRLRAEGGKKGGNPNLRKDKHGPEPLRLDFGVGSEDIPKERFRGLKSPTDSAPHPQRDRMGRILEIFEEHGRPLQRRSIGAWSKRLSAYAEHQDEDLDAACDALVADLVSIAGAGKLCSSSYALKIVDGLLEHGRTGLGIVLPRHRRADAGGHEDTRRAAEELD